MGRLDPVGDHETSKGILRPTGEDSFLLGWGVAAVAGVEAWKGDDACIF